MQKQRDVFKCFYHLYVVVSVVLVNLKYLKCESWFGHASSLLSLLPEHLYKFLGTAGWTPGWVRVLLRLHSVDDGTSRHRLPPPLPNPGPHCFYPESCRGQVDAVRRQTKCLTENMAFFFVSCVYVYIGSQVQMDLPLVICFHQLAILKLFFKAHFNK